MTNAHVSPSRLSDYRKSFDFAQLDWEFSTFSPIHNPLAAPSLVFCPFARTCLLHDWHGYACGSLLRGASPSRSPAEGSDHAQTGEIRRDHRGPW